tara:strand:+ start:276 stop:431 length:156 start_codon:yes stop_codon:yes gene_type:complete
MTRPIGRAYNAGALEHSARERLSSAVNEISETVIFSRIAPAGAALEWSLTV